MVIVVSLVIVGAVAAICYGYDWLLRQGPNTREPGEM